MKQVGLVTKVGKKLPCYQPIAPVSERAVRAPINVAKTGETPLKLHLAFSRGLVVEYGHDMASVCITLQ